MGAHPRNRSRVCAGHSEWRRPELLRLPGSSYRFDLAEAPTRDTTGTLADAAGPFKGRFEATRVGIPLLVHRRCQQPMFEISNQVAYEGLMVNGVAPGKSRIEEVLGPSRWIDVRGVGSGQDAKWCEDEGEEAMKLLRELNALGEEPDIYFISPFRAVQECLKARVRESGGGAPQVRTRLAPPRSSGAAVEDEPWAGASGP